MRTTLTALLLAGALLAAPHAHADVSDEICSQLTLGFTPDQIAAQLHSGDPRYNISTAPQTVWNAIVEQCP